MQTNNAPDEITLKEIILTAREYLAELLNNKGTLLLFTLPFVLWFAYKTTTTPPVYEGETKFFLEGDGGGMSGISGLLGQFGFKSGSGKNNPFRVLEVANSNLLLTEILFERMPESDDFMANKILEAYQLPEKWAEDNEAFAGFRFSHDSVPAFNQTEKVALRNIQKFLTDNEKGKALRTIGLDEEVGTYTIRAKTVSEELTLALNEVTYEKTRNYFEEKTMEGYRTTRDILKQKIDSIDAVVKNKMFQMNRFGDVSRDMISLEKGTKRDILQRDITGLTIAQAEAIKTYEMADYTYQNMKSLFMLVDRPYAPLEPQAQSWLINMLKAVFLGCFVGSFFIICRKIYRDAMA